MSHRVKSLSSLLVLAMLGLTLTGTARADTVMGERVTNLQIDACVSQINRHADYTQAHRVVHLVDRLSQKNLVELEVGINTSVYVGDDEAATRIYTTRCTTDTLGGVVSFRVSNESG